jgi:hypothetical protein
MVEPKVIHKQLKNIKFGGSPWNQGELRELPRIIHEGEIISECVNGFYEGGVALLVATNERLLLIDRKPLRFLTVEDLRFDMINEIDYSHRLMNASITITTGSRTLKFTSMNQTRLRHLINLVQEHMSKGKKDQASATEQQQQHLQEINKQLQMYLMAQHQHLQQQLAAQQQSANAPAQTTAEAPKPSPQLADYLFAHQLMEQFQKDNPGVQPPKSSAHVEPPKEASSIAVNQSTTNEDLIKDARQEVFGSKRAVQQYADNPATFFKGLEVNPLRVAYSKLPMMLRNRKFGRPSFHAHSQQHTAVTPPQTAVQ